MVEVVKVRDVQVGQLVEFEAPRVRTPPPPGGHDPFPQFVPGGTVDNPSRVRVKSRVVAIEPMDDGRVRLRTESKVLTVRHPDDRIAVA